MAYSITITNNTSSIVTAPRANPNSGESVNIYASTIAGLEITDNGIDVTNQFTQVSSYDYPQVASSYTSSGTFSGSGISMFSNAVGYTAEVPNGTSTSNAYAPSGSTSYVIYDFNFSAIPSDATITGVTVKVYGGAESSTYDSSHKCEIQLYSGTTTKGTAQHFTSTSNSIMTISSPGTWTREELQTAKLRATIAYYGGRVRGITWTVSYSWNGYKYTISSVAANHIIVVAKGDKYSLYLKKNNTWIKMSKIYKKENNNWTEISISELVDATSNYVVKQT